MESAEEQADHLADAFVCENVVQFAWILKSIVNIFSGRVFLGRISFKQRV